MGGSVTMLHKSTPTEQQQDIQPTKKKKRVGFFGALFRFVLAIVILGGAGFYAQQMISERPEPPKREPRERTFTVTSTLAAPGRFQPQLTYFGEVLAARNLEVRSQVAGKVVELAEGLAIGNAVTKGQLLAKIDDFNYRGALTEAQASLAEAEFSLAEAQERLALERANLDFVQSQYDLAVRDFERAKSLFDAGSITEKSLDDRELLVSQREQAVIQRKSNIIVQEAQLSRQQASIERIKWQVERAERNLADTEIYAPFDGIITASNIELGRLINNNEVLVSLYETNALDVRFTMSDQQYGQLLNDGLIGREIEVQWDVEPQPIVAMATISRTGAQIDATKGGVEVYASIDAEKAALLRPGSFVEISVPGLVYRGALRVPESAIYDNAFVYVDVDGRMSKRDVTIIARDGEFLLVRADIEPGTPIITTRIAQAGEGVAIINEGEPQPLPFARPNRAQRPDGAQNGERPGAGEGAGPRENQGQGQGQRPNRPNRRGANGEGSGMTTVPSN
jgi:multidrug efflux pump subunit AcrA (membrane-fusion protein)